MGIRNRALKIRILYSMVLISILVSCLSGCYRNQSGSERNGFSKWDPIGVERIESILKTHHVPGVSIAVIRGGEVEWARGYGLRQAGTRETITNTTLFQAASLSKPVTAAGALRLVANGSLSLNHSVTLKLTSIELPENRFAGHAPITLLQLLSHTAGLTVHGFPGYRLGEELPNLKNIIDGTGPSISGPIRLESEPGTEFHYSGGGYILIQQLMMDVVSMEFPDVMDRLILSPLGLVNSTFFQPLPAANRLNMAIGHSSDGNPIPGLFLIFPEMAAAGLWTTPTEYGHFICELWRSYHGISESLLPQQLTRKMLTPISSGWGLGVWLPPDGEFRFQHGGRNEGYHSFFMMLVPSGNGMVIMTNGESGDEVIDEVYDLIVSSYGW